MGLFVISILIGIVGLVFLLGRFKRAPRVSKIVGVIGVVIGGALLIASMFTVIDAGEVGVMLVFGRVQKSVLRNGIHLVPPYAQIIKYPVRLIEYTQVEENIIEVRASNGLNVGINCTALYSIDPDQAPEIYSKVAVSVEDLNAKIFTPILRTEIRNVVSRYSSEQLYTSKREEVQQQIEQNLRVLVQPKGLLIDQFLIRSIKLPQEVDLAIQAKMAAQQEAEAMAYRKQKAEQEAEIKIIEAKGLAEAQRIINTTLTPNYIQHEAIQAYRDLSKSGNATFVLMPTSPSATGVPLILNAQR